MCRSPNHSALSAIRVICCTGQCPVMPPPMKLLYSPLGSLVEVKCVESEFGVTRRSHCPEGAVPAGRVVTGVGAPGSPGGGGGAVGCCAARGAAAVHASAEARARSERRLRALVLIADAAVPAAGADPDRSARA